MDNVFLFGLVSVATLGVGLIGGWLMGRSGQRSLKRELAQLQISLQHSQNEVQQREEALQHSQKEVQQREEALQHSQKEVQQREEALQRNQQELQRSREELRQQQEELQRNQQDLLRSQEESRQYRTQVTQHFTQTADLLQTLTLNYRAVYEHLAAGAGALCDGQVKTLTPETLRERLLASPSEETDSEEVVAPQLFVSPSETEEPPTLSSQETEETEPQ